MADAGVEVHGGDVLRKRILLSVPESLYRPLQYVVELTAHEQKLV
jgi:hypothetical protein